MRAETVGLRPTPLPGVFPLVMHALSMPVTPQHLAALLPSWGTVRYPAGRRPTAARWKEFGGSLKPRTSSARHDSEGELLRTLERMAASGPTSPPSTSHHNLPCTGGSLRDLTRFSGLFPSGPWSLAPKVCRVPCVSRRMPFGVHRTLMGGKPSPFSRTLPALRADRRRSGHRAT